MRPPGRRKWYGTHLGDIITCFQIIVFSVLWSNCLLPLLPLNPCTVARQGPVSSQSQTCRVGVSSSSVCNCQMSKASCAVLCKYFMDLTLVTVIFWCQESFRDKMVPCQHQVTLAEEICEKFCMWWRKREIKWIWKYRPGSAYVWVRACRMLQWFLDAELDCSWLYWEDRLSVVIHI